MEMMILRARKDSSSIEVNMLGMMGTVSTQANSSMKEKLNIHCERTESPPPHFAAATMRRTSPAATKGARM